MTAVVRIGDYAQLGSHEQVCNIQCQQHAPHSKCLWTASTPITMLQGGS